jgi:RHS repeat-associated protein
VYGPSGILYYRHPDWLGSSRFASTPGRAKYYDVAYAPFGESYVPSGTTDLSYTGENQDAVAGHYDFLFREYNPVHGRWISPDPAGTAVVDPTNPQSWNRYAYVLNIPLLLSDALGLMDNGCVWHDDTNTLVCPDPPVGGGGGGICFTCGPLLTGGGGGGGGGAPNNGRNCSAGSASAGQYVAASAQVAAMTAQFFSGLGSANQSFGPGTATSAVMGQSAGVQEVLGSYYMTGQTSGLYTFGASGAYVAGGNPVAQFVGSFRWSISGGVVSLTNTTSLRSLTYDHGPQYQRGSFPTPGGNTHQTYQIGVVCH